MNGQEGWYVHMGSRPTTRACSGSTDPVCDGARGDPEPRPGIEPDIHGLAEHRRGRRRLPIARVRMTLERARWAREDQARGRRAADGAVIVEPPFAATATWPGRSSRKPGDAAVLELDDAFRQAVPDAAEVLAAP